MFCRRICAFLLSLAMLFTFAGALNADEARALLETYYIDPLPAAVWDADTVEGVIEALGDPYTRYMDAEAYDMFLSSMQDMDLVGAGIQLYAEEDELYVSRVFAGSAADGNLQRGDLIVSINDAQIAEIGVEAAWRMLMGDAGTVVSLGIVRDGAGAMTVTLTLAPFVFPTTNFMMLNGRVGYIECMTFGPETYHHFRDAVTEYDDEVDTWIVDLCDNGGGEMQAAADAVGLFVGSDPELFYIRDGDGGYYPFVNGADYLTQDPVIVLVNEASASASELFAATIRDSFAGIVIGPRTFGKGVGQLLLDKDVEPDYFSNGDGMAVTAIRNYVAASGSTPDTIGVVPDLMMSEENAGLAALLLSGAVPSHLTSGYLRLDMAGRDWYIDLVQAQLPDFSTAFSELLSALPPDAQLYRASRGTDWAATTAQEIAEQTGAVYAPHGFPDLGSSPFATEILTLASKGMLSGNERGEFMPESQLTRAELCAMLVKAIGYAMPDDSAETGFSDVTVSAWYAPYVVAMANQGLVMGYDGAFSPEAVLTHEQFMVVLSRVAARLNMYAYEMSLEGMDDAAIHSGDYNAYSDWAQDMVWLCDGLYFDDAVNIDPAAPTTRAEAAVSLYRMLYDLGYLTQQP